MIVIGGKKSSNTEKLFQIAKKHCNNVFKIETFKDLSLQDVSKFNTIGVTAGASTPDWIIEEVVNKMDNYSKDQFMEQVEDSITKIYPKDVVKGTIIYVTDTEVIVIRHFLRHSRECHYRCRSDHRYLLTENRCHLILSLKLVLLDLSP